MLVVSVVLGYTVTGQEGTGERRDEEILRRHFVAVATSTYTDPQLPDLPVAAEVQAMRAWWCDPRLGDRQFAEPYPQLADNPSEDQIRGVLRNPPVQVRWNNADAAVVFVTGHGVVLNSSHYLAVKDTELDRPDSTAIRTGDLVGWLAGTQVGALLLILDSCHAGKADGDLKLFDQDLPASWLVLASAGKNETAAVGALTSTVTALLAELATPQGRRYGDQPLINVHDFLTDIRDRLPASQTLQILGSGWPDNRHPCLPNPHPGTDRTVPVEQSRKDLALPRKDLEVHWGPRARGVASHEQPGWLFTGRATLMAALIAVVDGEPGITVITGGAGSGKSAVLARLVTLTDPEFLTGHAAEVAAIPKELRPRAGAVDVAVVATGKLHTQVLAQICHALGVTAPGGLELGEQPWLDALHTWLTQNDRPVTIVVDALDEANDPTLLLTTVLTRLDPTRQRIRLLIGVRSTGTDHIRDPDAQTTTANLADLAVLAGADARRIAVDTDPWWNQQDVIDYTTSILTNLDNSPYHSTGQGGPAADRIRAAAAGTAQTVGTHAGRSFLLAQIAATSLAAEPAITDPTSWQHALDRGITGVFSKDLHQAITDADQRYRAVILLRAVAFARGPGIPWRYVWPRIARAVDDQQHDYGDGDIAWLLQSRLGAYLITDHTDGTTVYRLFHDLLRNTLRTRWRELLQTPPA